VSSSRVEMVERQRECDDPLGRGVQGIARAIRLREATETRTRTSCACARVLFKSRAAEVSFSSFRPSRIPVRIPGGVGTTGQRVSTVSFGVSLTSFVRRVRATFVWTQSSLVSSSTPKRVERRRYQSPCEVVSLWIARAAP